MKITKEITLIEETCCSCDVSFAIPQGLQKSLQQTGDTFYCPRGHSMVFRDPDNLRLTKERDALAAKVKDLATRATALQDQAEAAERSARALRGEITKAKRRAANGVCPCCKRNFADLRRHIDAKHPGFVKYAKKDVQP